MRAAIYARYRTELQRDASIEDQIRLEAHRGGEVVAGWNLQGPCCQRLDPHASGLSETPGGRYPLAEHRGTWPSRGRGSVIRQRLCGGSSDLGLPIPGQEFSEPADWMVCDPREHVGQPSLRINVIQLAGLCRTANYAEHCRLHVGKVEPFRA
jgi:hypothetical protein